MTHPLNLCPTVEARPRSRYTTPKCTIRHRMAFPPRFAVDTTAFDYDPEAAYTWDHQWDDRAGGSKGGTCLKCGRTVAEIRVRVESPKRGLARAIAGMHADVPPLHFTGAP